MPGFNPSWQTTMTDLALILFLVVSAAQARPSSEAEQALAGQLQVIETPSTAVYRPASALTLEEWLAAQERDTRLTATVLVRRSADPGSTALATGNELLSRAESAGWRVRMLVEPGDADDVSVAMAYEGEAGTPLAQTES